VTTDTRPQPSVAQSLTTGAARALALPLTVPIGLAQLIGSGISALTPLKLNQAHYDQGTNILNSINDFTRFGTSPPTGVGQQFIEEAPSIATGITPAGVASGLAMFGIGHGRRSGMSSRTQRRRLRRGMRQPWAGGEAQPLAVPQGPQTSTSPPRPTSGVWHVTRVRIRFRGRSATANSVTVQDHTGTSHTLRPLQHHHGTSTTTNSTTYVIRPQHWVQDHTQRACLT
jgi:hypothetical protein